MAWDLDALRDMVREKFLETEMIDVTTKLSEFETVKRALQAFNNWGIRIRTLAEIPKIWHLMFYHDDEYASRLISGKEDQMQTARATLFSLTGDCEDVHRLYQIAAIALGERPENAKLMILFFGNEKNITGGHATTLIVHPGKYINLDYNYYVVAEDIAGIIQYHRRYANPVAYILLSIDKKTLREPVIKYSNDIKAFYAPTRIGKYAVWEVEEDENIRALKMHLHRKAEHSKESNLALLGVGIFALGILLGEVMK